MCISIVCACICISIIYLSIIYLVQGEKTGWKHAVVSNAVSE